MSSIQLPPVISGLRIHLVGAKGTGMTALAEILAAAGARLSGSDVADLFYTDAILAGLQVAMTVGFSAEDLPSGLDLIVHSAAYPRDRNPQLLEAARRGLPILSYPEALGALSARYDASGIAGVHGKTTTTAMAGSVVKALALPATVLAGSAVAGFGGRSTRIFGPKYLVAETCEYRRHFLLFHPRRIVLTSVESDHQDYYPAYADILAAFVEYGLLLPPGGELIFCADDPGAVEASEKIFAARPDLLAVPYGFAAEGAFKLESYAAEAGLARFRLSGFDLDFGLRVPGEHLALDATAALALGLSLLREERPGSAVTAAELEAVRTELLAFSGSKRRSEILGEAGGILFMDDYGHHPTAIRETLKGIKAFWPDRRLVVDFMAHTYSRTRALFDDFAACLDAADKVVLHKIYPSAREAPDPGMSGSMLYGAVARRRGERGGDPADVLYFEEAMAALPALEKELRPGDLFLTMGAGDNWRLGQALLETLRADEEEGE
jgi:UDP-N-acetylmuramate--alanine ligase